MGDLFIGSAICNVSARGELSLPNNFCVAIQTRQAKHQLFIALHDSAPCLIVFDRSGIAEQHQRLEHRRTAATTDLDRHDDLLRRAFGFAAPSRMDGRGRLLLAPWMQDRPGKRFRALVVGKADHFEVWDVAFVLKHGPELLRMLVRLHLHLIRHKEDQNEPALPFIEAPAGAVDHREPGLHLFAVPPVPKRPVAVAELF